MRRVCLIWDLFSVVCCAPRSFMRSGVLPQRSTSQLGIKFRILKESVTDGKLVVVFAHPSHNLVVFFGLTKFNQN